MRKFLLALALVAVATTAANAQLNLFYDVRATAAEIAAPAAPYTNSASLDDVYYYGQSYPLYNGGGRGDGQVIYLSPKLADVVYYTGFPPTDGRDEHWNVMESGQPDVDWSQGDFYLYAEYVSAAGPVISSIGVTQEIDPDAFVAADDKFYLDSLTVTPETPTLWDGTNFTGSDASISMKAVQVPVAAGPVFDNSAAYLNPGDFEQIASFHVETGYRTGSGLVPPTTYSLKLKVNELLCTQVAYPTAAGNLAMNMGYAAGSLDPLLGGQTGSDNNATSAADDMLITIWRKGDLDGDGTQCTGIDDLAYYTIALKWNGLPPPDTNINPLEQYLTDFDVDGSPATGVDDMDYYKHATGYIP